MENSQLDDEYVFSVAALPKRLGHFSQVWLQNGNLASQNQRDESMPQNDDAHVRVTATRIELSKVENLYEFISDLVYGDQCPVDGLTTYHGSFAIELKAAISVRAEKLRADIEEYENPDIS
jgi:hypothetical protein